MIQFNYSGCDSCRWSIGNDRARYSASRFGYFAGALRHHDRRIGSLHDTVERSTLFCQWQSGRWENGSHARWSYRMGKSSLLQGQLSQKRHWYVLIFKTISFVFFITARFQFFFSRIFHARPVTYFHQCPREKKEHCDNKTFINFLYEIKVKAHYRFLLKYSKSIRNLGSVSKDKRLLPLVNHSALTKGIAHRNFRSLKLHWLNFENETFSSYILRIAT